MMNEGDDGSNDHYDHVSDGNNDGDDVNADDGDVHKKDDDNDMIMLMACAIKYAVKFMRNKING